MNQVSRKRAFALLLGATLVLPSAAMGADAPPKAALGKTSPAASTNGERGHAATAHEVRLSKLIGMQVDDPAGGTLGKVDDVVLDSNTGRLHYAIVALGGGLGRGQDLFAVPLSRFRPDGRGHLTLSMSKQQLESAPSFNAGHWPDWNDESYRAGLERRYGAAPGRANARFRRASDLMKTKVRDSHGADIGSVSDIVVDLAQNQAKYAVVKLDRAWTPNDKLVAVSMDALSDGATFVRREPDAHAAGAPRNPPPVLAFESPPEPTRGTASAVVPRGGVETRPPALDLGEGAAARRLEREPLKTTTSYADDEGLVFEGSRQQLVDAPPFDPDRYPTD